MAGRRFPQTELGRRLSAGESIPVYRPPHLEEGRHAIAAPKHANGAVVPPDAPRPLRRLWSALGSPLLLLRDGETLADALMLRAAERLERAR